MFVLKDLLVECIIRIVRLLIHIQINSICEIVWAYIVNKCAFEYKCVYLLFNIENLWHTSNFFLNYTQCLFIGIRLSIFIYIIQKRV